MKLVPLVEDRVLRIAPHARATHLVDVEPGSLVIVVRLDVVAARDLEHRFRLGSPIANHLLGVVVVSDRCNETRDSPLVLLTLMQTDVIGLSRNGLALHVHVDPPRPGLRLRVFVLTADALRRRFSALAVGSCEGRVAADEVHFLLPEVAEIDEDALGRIPDVEVLVLEAIDLSTRPRAVVVVGDVLAQQPGVVAESVRESARCRVEEDESRVERGCVHEHDARVILGDSMGLRIDYADARRFSFRFVVNDGMHDGVWADGEVSGLCRPWKSGRVGTEVSTVRTSPHAQVPGLTRAAPLLEVDRFRL